MTQSAGISHRGSSLLGRQPVRGWVHRGTLDDPVARRAAPGCRVPGAHSCGPTARSSRTPSCRTRDSGSDHFQWPRSTRSAPSSRDSGRDGAWRPGLVGHGRPPSVPAVAPCPRVGCCGVSGLGPSATLDGPLQCTPWIAGGEPDVSRGTRWRWKSVRKGTWPGLARRGYFLAMGVGGTKVPPSRHDDRVAPCARRGLG